MATQVQTTTTPPAQQQQPGQGNGLDQVVNPTPGLAPELAGRGAVLPSFNFPAYQPDAPIDPRFANAGATGQAAPVDPGASPFSRAMGDFNLNLAADQQYRPLTQQGDAWDKFTNFFSRQDPTKPDINARAAAGAFYGRPEVANYIKANPSVFQQAQQDPVGTHKLLEPLINAAMNPTVTNVNGKTINDQAGVAAKMAATGLPANVVAPMHEPHQYTEEEFINSMRGLSWNHLNHILQLQPYMSPQQQAQITLSKGYSDNAAKARAAYDEATQPGSKVPPGQIETLLKNKIAREKESIGFQRSLALPTTAVTNQDQIEGQ